MLLPALSDEISSNLNLYCYHFERLLGICLFNVFLCVGAFALNLFVQALNNFEPLVSLVWWSTHLVDPGDHDGVSDEKANRVCLKSLASLHCLVGLRLSDLQSSLIYLYTWTERRQYKLSIWCILCLVYPCCYFGGFQLFCWSPVWFYPSFLRYFVEYSFALQCAWLLVSRCKFLFIRR